MLAHAPSVQSDVGRILRVQPGLGYSGSFRQDGRVWTNGKTRRTLPMGRFGDRSVTVLSGVRPDSEQHLPGRSTRRPRQPGSGRPGRVAGVAA